MIDIVKNKKKKPSQFSQVALIAGAIIVIFSFGFIVKNLIGTPAANPVVNVKEYEHLLSRAKELTSKYKALTGLQALPSDLTFNTITQNKQVLTADASVSKLSSSFDSLSMHPRVPLTGSAGTHIGGVTTGAVASAVTTVTAAASDDLVLGMAQDTDAKNLVSTLNDMMHILN